MVLLLKLPSFMFHSNLMISVGIPPSFFLIILFLFFQLFLSSLLSARYYIQLAFFSSLIYSLSYSSSFVYHLIYYLPGTFHMLPTSLPLSLSFQPSLCSLSSHREIYLTQESQWKILVSYFSTK